MSNIQRWPNVAVGKECVKDDADISDATRDRAYFAGTIA